ncbi:MAG: hypothetical protein L0H73_13380, partial [Nitrococcus sp.]|nr:hypothetical protein [Nitrococcus sp.]
DFHRAVCAPSRAHWERRPRRDSPCAIRREGAAPTSSVVSRATAHPPIDGAEAPMHRNNKNRRMQLNG